MLTMEPFILKPWVVLRGWAVGRRLVIVDSRWVLALRRRLQRQGVVTPGVVFFSIGCV